MRRKNFYIVEVDVYLVGLSLTAGMSQRIKQISNPVENVDKVVDVMLRPSSLSTPTRDSNICITLKFVRGVTQQQCVDAFVEAFKGCNADGTAKFSALLGEAIGQTGCKVGEEVNFHWIDEGGLFISKGDSDYFIKDPEIERRLLEIYVTSARTVSAELVKNFNSYLMEPK